MVWHVRLVTIIAGSAALFADLQVSSITRNLLCDAERRHAAPNPVQVKAAAQQSGP